MNTNNTIIYNERTFYPAFISDMLHANSEVIIYSPFISKFRADHLRKTLIKLKRKKIKLIIFTRPIDEHESYIREEVKLAISLYRELGANIVFLPGSIHEKVAIIDKKTIWSGSLNILSQRSSKEIMTRIQDEDFIARVVSHLKLDKKVPIEISSGGPWLLLTLKYAISSLLAIVRGIVLILLKSIMAVFKIVDVIL